MVEQAERFREEKKKEIAISPIAISTEQYSHKELFEKMKTAQTGVEYAKNPVAAGKKMEKQDNIEKILNGIQKIDLVQNLSFSIEKLIT